MNDSDLASNKLKSKFVRKKSLLEREPTREQLYRQKIDPYFHKYFNVETEVWSVCGKRIDYVLKCKEYGVLFGVEVKHTEHMRGTDMGEYLKQASGYSEMYWKTKFASTAVKIPIFITPAISNTIKQIIPESKVNIAPNWCDGIPHNEYTAEYYQTFHKQNDKHSNVHGMISSAFGIGEIKTIDNHFVFMYANKPIWQNNYNRLHITNYNFYWGGNHQYISYPYEP